MITILFLFVLSQKESKKFAVIAQNHPKCQCIQSLCALQGNQNIGNRRFKLSRRNSNVNKSLQKHQKMAD